MTETIVDQAHLDLEEALADLAEVKTYEKEAKERVAAAKASAKSVDKAVTYYAPRVVTGVTWLNKNARGWAKALNDPIGSIDVTLTEEDGIKFGLLPADKHADIADDVLAALWETALKIHKQKKPVTLPRLLKKVGV